MGRRQGRRLRLSHVVVRTQRREEIDVHALARAILEQAAADAPPSQAPAPTPSPPTALTGQEDTS